MFQNKEKYLKTISLKQFSSIGTNVVSYLVHGFKSSFQYNKFSCSNCNNFGCETCKFIPKKTDSLQINNFIFPILSNCNCQSVGLIYVIACNLCNVFFIGESGRTADKRFKEHIYNIKKFQYNLTYSISNLDKLSEVAVHFNKKGHNFNENLDFYILDNNLNSFIIRKSKETDLINYFKLLVIKILNKKQHKFKYITKLFFSDL